MPRLRCHWALLSATRTALRDTSPALAELLDSHRAEFFAGGVAPDALRVFGGADKISTHFYDDQRPETWPHVIATITARYPSVADPTTLPSATRAWMAGYLAHIATDVAYWANILPHLPPFPERAEAHHGAWLIADDLPIPSGDRRLDPEAVDYSAAPPWVAEDSVRRMLIRLQERILVDGMWPVELAYYRTRPDAAQLSDDELLARHVPSWQENLGHAHALVPSAAWQEFHQDAVRRSALGVLAYLARPLRDASGETVRPTLAAAPRVWS